MGAYDMRVRIQELNKHRTVTTHKLVTAVTLYIYIAHKVRAIYVMTFLLLLMNKSVDIEKVSQNVVLKLNQNLLSYK